MKLLVSSIASLSLIALTACESTNSRKAGGGSFDESHLAQKLDANAHLDDPETPGARTYEEWREKGE
ncbi:MAG: hypothetical protein ACQKBY_08505 [Verrucomicrobiales bacterium]